jgi:hypothetical protein
MSENPNDKDLKNDPNLGNEFLLPPRLKVLAELCSKNEGRYSMQGVILKRTPEGYEACATDGRFLGRVKGRFPEDLGDYPDLPGMNGADGRKAVPEALVPAKEWKECLGLAPKQDRWTKKPMLDNVLVRTYAKDTTFGATDLSKSRVVTVQNEEGRYPDYEAVIPDGKKCLTVDVDADKLIALLKVAREFPEGKVDGDHGACRVRLEVRRGRKWVGPLTVRCSNRDEEFTGILMPLSEHSEEEV